MTEKVEYFNEKDWTSQHLPDVTWEEMLAKHEIIRPDILNDILKDAKTFLLMAEGPNQAERIKLVPGWLGYWNIKLQLFQNILEPAEDDRFVRYPGARLFHEVKPYIARKKRKSGLQNLAGGEGTEGHVWSYEYMRSVLGKDGLVIWAFERDSYFEKYKERAGPFLPLTARITMALIMGVDVATVLPEVPENSTHLSKHYLKCFRQTGAEYSFANALDSHRDEKISRGKADLNTVIPHLEVPSTRRRVAKLQDDIVDWAMEDISLRLDDDVMEWIESLYPEMSHHYGQAIGMEELFVR